MLPTSDSVVAVADSFVVDSIVVDSVVAVADSAMDTAADSAADSDDYSAAASYSPCRPS